MATVVLTTIYDAVALGQRIMASCLEQAGHKVSCVFLESWETLIQGWNGENIHHYQYAVVNNSANISIFNTAISPLTMSSFALYLDTLEELAPDIIGFGVRSYFDENVEAFLRAIKDRLPNTLIICGGFGPTFNPDAYLTVADYVVLGEGEGAIVDIANAVDKAQSCDNIPNLSYYSNEHRIDNPMRTAVNNLDDLPFPMYRRNTIHIKNNIRDDNDSKMNCYTFLAGRGCLGTCSYCAGGNWPKMYHAAGLKMCKRRNRSVSTMIEELQWAKNNGFKYILFVDEHFAMSYEKMIKFFQEYKEKINLGFAVFLHTAQIVKHPDIAKIAAEAGCKRACIGIQSGSESFSRQVYCRKNNNEEIVKAAHIWKKNKVGIDYHFIMGNSLEGQEDIDKTYILARNLPAIEENDAIISFFFTPLPGAPIMERFKDINEARTSINVFVYQSYLLLLTGILNEKDFEELKKVEYFKKEYKFLKPIIEDHVKKL